MAPLWAMSGTSHDLFIRVTAAVYRVTAVAAAAVFGTCSCVAGLTCRAFVRRLLRSWLRTNANFFKIWVQTMHVTREPTANLCWRLCRLCLIMTKLLQQFLVVRKYVLIIGMGWNAKTPLRNLLLINDLNSLVELALLIMKLLHATLKVLLHLVPDFLFNFSLDATSLNFLNWTFMRLSNWLEPGRKVPLEILFCHPMVCYLDAQALVLQTGVLEMNSWIEKNCWILECALGRSWYSICGGSVYILAGGVWSKNNRRISNSIGISSWSRDWVISWPRPRMGWWPVFDSHWRVCFPIASYNRDTNLLLWLGWQRAYVQSLAQILNSLVNWVHRIFRNFEVWRTLQRGSRRRCL